MPKITVKYKGGALFEAKVGNHTLLTEVPPEMVGKDRISMSSEHFLRFLNSYVKEFIADNYPDFNIDTKGMSITLVRKTKGFSKGNHSRPVRRLSDGGSLGE